MVGPGHVEHQPANRLGDRMVRLRIGDDQIGTNNAAARALHLLEKGSARIEVDSQRGEQVRRPSQPPKSPRHYLLPLKPDRPLPRK